MNEILILNILGQKRALLLKNLSEFSNLDPKTIINYALDGFLKQYYKTENINDVNDYTPKYRVEIGRDLLW